MGMAGALKSCKQYVCFATLILVVDHVQALQHSPHGYPPGDQHWVQSRRPVFPQELWTEPPSRPKQLHRGGSTKFIAFGGSDADSNPMVTDLRRELAGNSAGIRSAETSSETSRQEVEALASFKAAVSGGDLYIFRSWQANDSTACGWAGVTCSSTEQPSHVIALNISDHALVGSINDALLALSKLQFLQKLDLSRNNFSSSIPEAALANLSRLSTLNLSRNQISGEIPSQIGDLANLRSLDFYRNALSGQIPASIINCTLLVELNLGQTLLGGQIPRMIGRLSNLQSLVLGVFRYDWDFDNPELSNRLEGSIPGSLSNCSSLEVLELSNVQGLGGQFPSELGLLRSLQYLSLSRLLVQGTLQPWIGNVTSLRILWLDYNKFRGAIPAEFGRLRNLTVLVLQQNYLTGNIPEALFNCTSLVKLLLGENSLGGVIPSQIGSLKNLETLFLYANDFTGIIPPTIANCSSLTGLDIGYLPFMDSQTISSWLSSLTRLRHIYLVYMNLHGQLPSDIGKLSELTELQMFANDLSGSIPVSLTNCTFLNNLHLAANSLTGQIPSEIGLLERVQNFQLSDNFLTGSLPLSITNMTQVQNLYVADNLLNGTIDRQWGELPDLRQLLVSGNRFIGSSPSSLGNCSTLYVVSMGQNALTGVIPASFGNLSNLEQLSLPDNQIRGEFPGDLLRCSKLGNLDLSTNKMEGPLSISFGRLLSLHSLNLSHNLFYGAIPESLRNCKQLVNFDLSYNRFSGTIPETIVSRMLQLTSINVSHNNFSGSWPADWRDLEVVETIDISANAISGPIPSLGELKNLQKLDISINNFSGNIPQSLGSLRNLTFFNASYNDFEGPVPTSGAFKSNITGASFLQNPRLCGAILGPSRQCLTVIPHSNENCKHFNLKCKSTWIPFTVVVVSAVLLSAAGLVWWIWIALESKRKEDFELCVNFAPHLRFAATDILGIVRERDNVIGSSANTVVYKGSIPGFGVVAVKTPLGDDEIEHMQELELWRKHLAQEARIQANLRHRNILKILSICSTLDFRALLFEYMPQGSLQDHLYPAAVANNEERKCALPWSVRFGIAIDIAEGMSYLHHDCPDPLVHGDLKPSNILLDEEMVARVADFGISKLVSPNKEGHASASTIRGTIGYLPPEYGLQTTVSTKGDVYSFGIVLLEILSGKQPGSADYRSWFLDCFQERLVDMLDQTLRQESLTDALKTKQMMLVSRIALFSTRNSPQDRPSMKDALSMLRQVEDLSATPVLPVTKRTIEELAHDDNNDISLWENADPNEATLPPISA